MNQMQFDYYYGLEGEQFTFVKIHILMDPIDDKAVQDRCES